jgi:hypothetical protein
MTKENPTIIFNLEDGKVSFEIRDCKTPSDTGILLATIFSPEYIQLLFESLEEYYEENGDLDAMESVNRIVANNLQGDRIIKPSTAIRGGGTIP